MGTDWLFVPDGSLTSGCDIDIVVMGSTSTKSGLNLWGEIDYTDEGAKKNVFK